MELYELPIQREPRSVAFLFRRVDSYLTELLQDSALALRRDADPPSLLARADEVIQQVMCLPDTVDPRGPKGSAFANLEGLIAHLSSARF